MRFANIVTSRGPRLCVVEDDRLFDVNAGDDSLPNDLRRLLNTDHFVAAVQRVLEPDRARKLTRDDRFLPPITDPQKIICLGLNYRDHAIETGAAIPSRPVVFNKFATALIGPDEAIVLPPVSQEVDYEAELVVVIGRRAKLVTAAHAMDYVAGYTIGHDVSARDWQKRIEGKQWLLGKSFDTFAPLGPYFVTKDEVPDPHDLKIQLRLNGQVMQDSNTSQLIFQIPAVIEYLTSVFTLEPGDLIFTGTPHGVGFVRQPPVYLKPGDSVEIEIENLGVLRNPVRGS